MSNVNRRFSRLMEALGLSMGLASAALMSACIRPQPGSHTGKGSDHPTVKGFYAGTAVEFSGTKSRGGLTITVDPQGNAQLPVVAVPKWNPKLKGDARTLRVPSWLFFHHDRTQDHGALQIEFVWIQPAKGVMPPDQTATIRLASSPEWREVDASKAKYLVMYAQMSDPGYDLRLTLESVNKSKGRNDTGYVNLSDYAVGQKVGKDWTKILIPLSSFPDVNKVDLSGVQTLIFDLTGRPPEGKKPYIRINDVYFTDADIVTPVENLGYLVRSDGILLMWEMSHGTGVKEFTVKLDNKLVAHIPGDKRVWLLPHKVFPDNKKHRLDMATIGQDEFSPPVTLNVSAEQPAEATAVVQIASAVDHKISPFMFGANFANVTKLDETRFTVNRWGGPRSSKYNWQGDVDGAGSKYYFMNGDSNPRAKDKDKAYYQWIAKTRAAGAEPIFTIPIGQWIARPHPEEHERYCSFPKEKYPEQKQFDPDGEGCGNGEKPDGSIIWGNDPKTANIENKIENQEKLVQTIKKSFGGAKNPKGVRYFELDNEPGAWLIMHRDVAPKGITTDELVELNIKYAKMIKSVDPDAQVIGYSAWGPADLAGSNVDFMPPGPEGYKNYGGAAKPSDLWRERKKHNNVSAFEYYLTKMKEAEAKEGKRLIDVVDVHWYPDVYGVNNAGDYKRLSDDLDFESGLAEQQFDALREWWDPSYENPSSWLANQQNKPYLWTPYHPVLPMLKKIVDATYPGTKLAINEYDSGSHSFFHGAVLRAATMGIFMDQNVYMAEYAYPDNQGQTAMYFVDMMFNNFDGKGGAVRGDYHKTMSNNPDLYGFATQEGARWQIVLVNKSQKERMRTTLSLPSKVSKYRTYLLTESIGLRLMPESDRPPTAPDKVTLYVPPLAAMLVVAQ